MGFLKGIFGPSQEEIWKQIADEIGGEFIDGGFWEEHKVAYKHREWTILLDTYVSTTSSRSRSYTRLRAPFKNKDRFYFNVYKEGFFAYIGKLFGMQDLKIGDPFFDKFFVIQSNNEEKVKTLLNSDELKQLILTLGEVRFNIQDTNPSIASTYPKRIDMLYFDYYGIIKERKVLLDLFQLFSTVLERLVQMDSAYEDDPNITSD